MKLAAVWLYPIKSMAGIPLSSSQVTISGLRLDRNIALRDRETRKILTAIKYPSLLQLQPEVGDPESLEELRIRFPEGEVLALEDSRLQNCLSEFVDRPIELARDGRGIFDGTTIHLTTDLSLRYLSQRVGVPVQAQNFRANFQVSVTDANEGFVEAKWIGGGLRLGREVELSMDRGCPRCVMSTTDPTTLQRNPEILTLLKSENQGCFGIYASVARMGRVAVGDLVRLLN